MQDDAAEDRYPLGAPIRDEPAPQVEQWVAPDPSKPHIQQSTLTGKWRNVRATPPAKSAYPWFGVA